MSVWLGSPFRGKQSTSNARLAEQHARVVVKQPEHRQEVVQILLLEEDAAAQEQQGKYQESIHLLERSLILKDKVYGNKHPEVLNTCEKVVNLANVYSMQYLAQTKFDESLDLLKIAENLTEANLYPFQGRVKMRAVTFNNLACYFRRRNKLNAALQYAQKALGLEEKYKEADNPAGTHLNLGTILSQLNRHNEALQHAQAAVFILLEEMQELSSETGLIDTPSLPSDATTGTASAVPPSSFSASASASATASPPTAAATPLQHQQQQPKYLSNQRAMTVIHSLVVAYHNLAVEQEYGHLFDSAVEARQKALQTALTFLGPTHQLTHKMQTAYNESCKLQLQRQEKVAERQRLPPLKLLPQQDAASSPSSSASPTSPSHTGGKSSFSSARLVSPSPPARRHNRSASRPQSHSAATTATTTFKRPISRPASSSITNKPIPPPRYASASVTPSPRKEVHIRASKSFTSQPGQTRSQSPLYKGPSRTPTPSTGFRSTSSSFATAAAAAARRPDSVMMSFDDQFDSSEYQAATQIQRAWRKYLLHQMQVRNQQLPYSHRMAAIDSVKQKVLERLSLGLPKATFRERRVAATKIQSAWKGYMVRRQLAVSPTTTTSGRHSGRVTTASSTRSKVSDRVARMREMRGQQIQSNNRQLAIRVVQAARSQLKQERAAIKIQSAFRGFFTRMVLVRLKDMKRRKAAAQIQATWRGYSWRQHQTDVLMAAVMIQSLRRSIQSRSVMTVKHDSATLLQTHWRHLTSLRNQSQHEATMTRIQRVFRSHAARIHNENAALAASKIRATWKMYQARCRIVDMLNAALTIQRRVRAMVMRKRVQFHSKSASIAGAQLRRFAWQQRTKRRTAAATTIKTYWIASKAREYLHRVKTAAVHGQRLIRGGRQREELTRRQRAAKVIQAKFRTRNGKLLLKAARVGVTRLQGIYRGNVSRKRVNQFERRAIEIQCKWRMALDRRKLAAMRTAAWRFNALCRKYLTQSKQQRKVTASTKIQSVVRMYQARCRYLYTQSMIRKASSHARAWVYARRYQLVRKFALRLQGIVKAARKRKVARKESMAAVAIQRQWRVHRALDTMKKTHLAIWMLRRRMLMWKARVQNRKYKSSLANIRTLMLSWMLRAKLRVQLRHIRSVQSHVRRYLQQKQLQHQHQSARIVQHAYRNHLVRNRLRHLHQVACTLQKHTRKQLSLQRYLKVVHGVVRLQAIFRGNRARALVQQHLRAKPRLAWVLLGIRARKHFHQLQQAARTIQRPVRRSLVLKEQEQFTRKVTKLQSMVRTHQHRQRYQRIRAAAVKLQSFYHIVHAKQWKRNKLQCIVRIQTQWRKSLCWLRVRRLKQLMDKVRCTLLTAVLSRRHKKQLQQYHRAKAALQAHYVNQVRLPMEREAAKTLQRAALSFLLRVSLGNEAYYATKIQRRFRAGQSRVRLDGMHQAALKIQCCWKQARARMEAAALRLMEQLDEAMTRHGEQVQLEQLQSKSAALIQRWIAPILYKLNGAVPATRAATLVGSVAKSFLTRLQQQKESSATVTIQSAWKRVRQQRRYASVRLAAAVIARNWKGHLHRNRVAELMRRIATLKSYMVRWIVSHRVQKKHRQVLSAQANLLALLQRRRYQRLRRATVLVQRQFRARAVRLLAKQQHQAASLIQLLWRQHHKKTMIDTSEKAAAVVQQHFRFNRFKRACLQREQARILLQNRVRTMLLRQRFHRIQAVVRRFQPIAKGWVVRRRVAKEQAAVETVQTVARSHRAMETVRAERAAYAKVKAVTLAVMTRFRLKKLRAATICLQRNWRSHHDRNHVKKMVHQLHLTHQAVLRWRKLMEHNRYLRSIEKIQNEYRKYQVRRRVQQHNRTKLPSGISRLIQAIFVGYRVRKQVALQRQAATKIQACCRAYLEGKEQQRIHSAATQVQKMWLGHAQRNRFHQFESALIRAQALVRGMIARHLAAEVRDKSHRLTSSSKTFVVKKRNKYTKRISALLQKCTRWLRFHTFLFKHQRAVHTIARVVRGHLCRRTIARQRDAVVRLQRWYRYVSAVQAIHKRSWARSILQNNTRAFLTRQKLAMHQQRKQLAVAALLKFARRFRHHRMYRAATRIGAWYHRLRAVQAFHRRYGAALTVQRVFRGARDRTHVRTMRAGLLTVQAFVRGVVARRSIVPTRLQAANKLQRLCNSIRFRTRINKRIWARRILQRGFHHTLDRRLVQRRVAAATRLQSFLRMVHDKMYYRKASRAALMIQRVRRMLVVRRAYRTLKWAANRLRHFAQMVNMTREYGTKKEAAVVMHRVARGFLLRRESSKQLIAATKLQARNRTMSAKSYASLLRNTVSRILLFVLQQRRRLAKYRFNRSTVKIQALFRGVLARRRFHERQNSALLIQRNVRSHLAKRLLRAQRAMVASRAAAAVVQSIVHTVLYRRDADLHSAATTLQRHWRGVASRRHVSELKQSRLQSQANSIAHSMWSSIWFRFFYQHKDENRAAVAIQSAWRMFAVRQWLRRMRECTTRRDAEDVATSVINRIIINCVYRLDDDVNLLTRAFSKSSLPPAATTTTAGTSDEPASEKQQQEQEQEQEQHEQEQQKVAASVDEDRVVYQPKSVSTGGSNTEVPVIPRRKRIPSAPPRSPRRFPQKAMLRARRIAATKIQACWKGYLTRIRLATLGSTIGGLQSKFKKYLSNQDAELKRIKMEALRDSSARTIQTTWRKHQYAVLHQSMQEAVTTATATTATTASATATATVSTPTGPAVAAVGSPLGTAGTPTTTTTGGTPRRQLRLDVEEFSAKRASPQARERRTGSAARLIPVSTTTAGLEEAPPDRFTAQEFGSTDYDGDREEFSSASTAYVSHVVDVDAPVVMRQLSSTWIATPKQTPRSANRRLIRSADQRERTLRRITPSTTGSSSERTPKRLGSPIQTSVLNRPHSPNPHYHQHQQQEEEEDDDEHHHHQHPFLSTSDKENDFITSPGDDVRSTMIQFKMEGDEVEEDTATSNNTSRISTGHASANATPRSRSPLHHQQQHQ